MRNVIVLVISSLLAACSFSPTEWAPQINLPQSWGTQAETEAKPEMIPVQPMWWQQFNDPVLNQLVEEGLTANADVLTAAARVAEARGVVGVNQADFFPTLDVQGSADRTGPGRLSRNSVVTSGKPYNSYSLAAVLSYELDLWGRIRSLNGAARARLLAEESVQEAVRLTVASDIANAYFTLRALDAQEQATINTLKAREEENRLQTARYEQGATDAMTFNQSQAELQNARATLPQIRQARVEQETALAVLLGRDPQTLVEGTLARGAEIESLPVPPAFQPEAPSTLMLRRPDIQAAEQTMLAANEDIGAARANYLPQISLGSLIGLSSADADDLFRGAARNWNIGVSAAGPLWDWGRTSSNVEATQARKAQADQNYLQVVRTAFKEVIDAVQRVENTRIRAEAAVAEEQARAEVVRTSRLRYDAGYSDYLEVLDSERTLYAAQQNKYTALQQQLSAYVSLYKALGGGFGTSAEIAPASQTEPVVEPAAAPIPYQPLLPLNAPPVEVNP